MKRIALACTAAALSLSLIGCSGHPAAPDRDDASVGWRADGPRESVGIDFAIGHPRAGSDFQSMSPAYREGDPARVGADGWIYVEFDMYATHLPGIAEAYVSQDAKGKTRGPEIICDPSSSEAPGVGLQRWHFLCRTSFTETTSSDGTYWLVIRSSPTYNTGASAAIRPFYTRKP